ncbi:MAG: hypothetical protein HDS65_03995 [Bacteroidales bacterium]|nr:hypothetical protein [Bacteroidales bacterium]
MKLTDPAATAGTALAVKRNHLYRIIITKATKLNFDIKVADWEEEEPYVAADIKLNLDPDEQEELNKKLLVYDLFTEYPVKEFDLDNKKVKSFFTSLPTSDGEWPSSSFYLHSELKDKGILSNDAYVTDEDNNMYRMPTAGELQLLVPMFRRLTDLTMPTLPDGSSQTISPNWNYPEDYNYDKYPVTPFPEKVYLKNNSDLSVLKADITTESENGFIGETILRQGRVKDILYITPVNQSKFVEEPSTNTTINYIRPIYALRFAGTKQYSAYKWESLPTNGDRTRRYLSIKIKALKEDSNITIDDIVDNHSFWADGYIEVIIPTQGAYVKDAKYNPGWGYMLSSSYGPEGSKYSHMIFLTTYDTNVNSVSTAYKYPIRLVKIKNNAAEGSDVE